MHIKQDIPRSPLMAVLVNDLTILNLRNQVVSPRIQLLVEANKLVNLNLYYFSMSGVSLKEYNIWGCYWNEQENTWLEKEFSFPDVLYIRGGFATKYTPRFETLWEILNSGNAKIINYPSFNKWHLFQTINNDPEMKSYLPATAAVKQPEDIKNMLQTFQTVYLKPHNGRRGRYVLQVKVLPNGSYRYSYFEHNNGEAVIKTVDDYQRLLAVIYNFFHGKSFLIQQAIALVKYEESLIDMRAELQRNGEGNVEITGISIRLGKPNYPITTHGDAYIFEEFFNKMFNYSAKKIMKLQSAIHEFLLGMHECIEKNYGEYVEIGIDFALDVNEKIWFIEANSQSTKISLEKAYGDEVLSRAYRNILEYARFVSNNSIGVQTTA